MDTTARSYDVIAMGRSSIDLYSNDIGAPFVDITSFAAYVGGCPTNISVGTRRLGLHSALLTAVGDDQVGNFIVHFLQRESVETRFIPRKPERRSSAVVAPRSLRLRWHIRQGRRWPWTSISAPTSGTTRVPLVSPCARSCAWST